MKPATIKNNGRRIQEQELAPPQKVLIEPPNIAEIAFHIRGTAPLCINRFSAKSLAQMADTQAAGQQSKKGRRKQPKDFAACYEDSKHVSTDEWLGIAASAFRCALISACRMVDFKMTRAKLSLFCIADGIDKNDHTPLVKITKGTPRRVDGIVRNANGNPDIRPRPVWDPGWEMIVRIQFDADQFSVTDVTNLMVRVGAQVGIGEGRHDSKFSAGIGYGTFKIVND